MAGCSRNGWLCPLVLCQRILGSAANDRPVVAPKLGKYQKTKKQLAMFIYVYIYSRNQSSLGCANDFEPCPISFSSYTCWEICTAYNWLSSLVGTVQTLVFLINMMFESNSWGEFPFRIYCLRWARWFWLWYIRPWWASLPYVLLADVAIFKRYKKKTPILGCHPWILPLFMSCYSYYV